MEELNKNNPFKTPESYFENFSDALKDKLSEDKLDLPQEDGYAVPENYFNGVHASILEKLEKKETKVVQLHPYKKYYAAVASIAAIALVFLGLNWNTTPEVTWEDIAHTEIEAYFENNDFDLTSYEIAEVLPIDELEINDILENQFNEDNVLEYLNENITDFEELNLEDYE